MIIDTSALLTILFDEEDARQFAKAIEDAPTRRISAASFVETGAVIDRNGDGLASRAFDDLMRKWEIIIEPVTEHQTRIARDAYRDFGKGSNHAAKLNFGDCFAYALSKDFDEPLLFKGRDFSETDVVSGL